MDLSEYPDKTLWYCMMQLQDSSVSPTVFLLKMGPLTDKQKLCVAKNAASPVIWGYLANLFIYQTNKCAEDLIWKKPMFCFSRVSACPSHCLVCLLFHPLVKQYGIRNSVTDLRPPQKKENLPKKDMIFDCLGETVTEHMWYEFFEVIDSPNFHLLFPGNILNKGMCFFFPEIPSISTFERYAAFDKRDLLLNGIEQAINSSNKHTKVGGKSHRVNGCFWFP